MLMSILKAVAVVSVSLLALLGGFAVISAINTVRERRRKEAESVDIPEKQDPETAGQIEAHREQIVNILTMIQNIDKKLSIVENTNHLAISQLISDVKRLEKRIADDEYRIDIVKGVYNIQADNNEQKDISDEEES